jgi:mRNA interferase YafQ
MFTLKFTNQFKKDVKIVKKRSSKNAELITDFLEKLETNGVAGVDRKYMPHKLSGDYNNNWEAHLKPDLLIIWFEMTVNNEIILLRLGSHADLF